MNHIHVPDASQSYDKKDFLFGQFSESAAANNNMSFPPPSQSEARMHAQNSTRDATKMDSSKKYTDVINTVCFSPGPQSSQETTHRRKRPCVESLSTTRSLDQQLSQDFWLRDERRVAGINLLNDVKSIWCGYPSLSDHALLRRWRNGVVFLTDDVSARNNLPRLTSELGRESRVGVLLEGSDVLGRYRGVDVIVENLLGVSAGDCIFLFSSQYVTNVQ